MSDLHPVRVFTPMNDEVGRLVLVDGRLAAVIVRLDDPEHGDMTGKWLLEWSAVEHLPSDDLFASPKEAAAWVERRLIGA